MSVYKMFSFLFKCFLIVTIMNFPYTNNAVLLNQTIDNQNNSIIKLNKYSTDDLFSITFSSRISGDIDMDPCKSGNYRHNIFFRVIHSKLTYELIDKKYFVVHKFSIVS